MIKVTVKDLLTEEIKVYPDNNITVFSWTYGNWSCDCNRVIAFREVSSVDFDSPCECKRYVVVSAEGDLEGMTEEDFIEECNREYLL